jgi:hypothetical protein
VFGFGEEQAICELGQRNHPLSWHDGVEAIVRGKTRRGNKKVLYPNKLGYYNIGVCNL